MSELKEKIKEIVDIVALVPDQFQTMCFELLLKEAIADTKPAVASRSPAAMEKAKKNEVIQDEGEALGIAPLLEPTQPKVDDGTDIAATDIHMKVRKFLEKSDLTINNLNELFYKENGVFASLITDLGVTKMSEAQTRIALLQALHNALATGDFVTTVESVREECKMRKSYDSANFASNIKNNSSLFDFSVWTKDVTELKLSEEGRKSLASIVKTLS